MRVGMGLIKNEHGVWHVRRKVPKALEAATATVMGVPKERVALGSHQAALEHIGQYERLSLRDPHLMQSKLQLAYVHVFQGRYEEAAHLADKSLVSVRASRRAGGSGD